MPGKDLIAAYIALAGVLITTLIGLYWNFRNARNARKLPFLQRQLDLCFEASDIVSLLATTDDVASFAKARDRFWQLYHGPLAIVEDSAVEACMVECGRLIAPTGQPEILPIVGLSACSLELSIAIRQLLVRAWSVQDLVAVLEGKTGLFEEVGQTFRDEYRRQMSART